MKVHIVLRTTHPYALEECAVVHSVYLSRKAANVVAQNKNAKLRSIDRRLKYWVVSKEIKGE